MQSKKRKLNRHHRSGYTILELLLVLGILLAMTAIIWPRVQFMYERHRLKAGVDDVRAYLAGTRLRAIETGVVYQFLYEPGGQNFYVQPFEVAAREALPSITGTLPEQMRFDTADINAAAGNSPPNVTPLDASANGLSNVAAPILFAPDGSATDAAFTVSDDDNQYVRLSVRGLTAAVTVGNVRQRPTR